MNHLLLGILFAMSSLAFASSDSVVQVKFIYSANGQFYDLIEKKEILHYDPDVFFQADPKLGSCQKHYYQVAEISQVQDELEILQSKDQQKIKKIHQLLTLASQAIDKSTREWVKCEAKKIEASSKEPDDEELVQAEKRLRELLK